MAEVELNRSAAEAGTLPGFCLRCASPTRNVVRKAFSVCPWWAIFLGSLGRYLLSKRVTVGVPLCDAHRWHWRRRTQAVIAIVAGFFAAGWVMTIGAVMVNDRFGLMRAAFLLVFFLAVPAAVLALVVLSLSRIRAVKITDATISLTNVSLAFVLRLQQDRGDGVVEFPAPVAPTASPPALPAREERRPDRESFGPRFDLDDGPGAASPESRKLKVILVAVVVMLVLGGGGVLLARWWGEQGRLFPPPPAAAGPNAMPAKQPPWRKLWPPQPGPPPPMPFGPPGGPENDPWKLHQKQIEEARKRLEQRQREFRAMQEEAVKRHEQIRKQLFEGMPLPADPNPPAPENGEKKVPADPTSL